MGYYKSILNSVLKQLLPSGRAYRVPDNGDLYNLIDSINTEEENVYNDITGILNSILPDNDNFLEEDASEWEKRLGMIRSPNGTLEDRKSAIIRKMNHPGVQKARQNFRYIQEQLRLAGFDVYVYENRFDDGNGGYVTRTPQEVSQSVITTNVQYGGGQYGNIQYGGQQVNKIANSIRSEEDLNFDVGDNLKSTFFISSETLGINAVIDETRQEEFRKLVLTLKPAQSVAFAFVDIVPPVIENILTQSGGNIKTQSGGNLLKQNSFA